MSTTNGGPAPQASQPQMPVPQIGVLVQYVKDFSFENPNAPRSLSPNPQQPAIQINVGVDATPLSDNDIEVTLRLKARRKRRNFYCSASNFSIRGCSAFSACRPKASSRWF